MFGDAQLTNANLSWELLRIVLSAVGYYAIVVYTVPRNHRNTSQNLSSLLEVRVVTWPV
jgi:hypothetical protein